MLSLSDQVKIWFQNKRSKCKKILKQQGGAPNSGQNASSQGEKGGSNPAMSPDSVESEDESLTPVATPQGNLPGQDMVSNPLTANAMPGLPPSDSVSPPVLPSWGNYPTSDSMNTNMNSSPQNMYNSYLSHNPHPPHQGSLPHHQYGGWYGHAQPNPHQPSLLTWSHSDLCTLQSHFASCFPHFSKALIYVYLSMIRWLNESDWMVQLIQCSCIHLC